MRIPTRRNKHTSKAHFFILKHLMEIEANAGIGVINVVPEPACGKLPHVRPQLPHGGVFAWSDSPS